MQETKRSQYLRYIITALAVISCVVIVTSLGNIVANPFRTALDIESVTSSTINKPAGIKSGAIVDQAGSRLVFVDENGYVAQTHDASLLAEHPQSYGQVTKGEKDIYVVEVEHENNSPLVASERIVRYSESGIKSGVVVEYDYENDQSAPIEYGRIVDVNVRDSKGYAVVNVPSSASFDVVEFDSQSGEPGNERVLATLSLPDKTKLYSAQYDPDRASILAIDILGRAFEANVPAGTWTPTTVEGDLGNALGIEFDAQGGARTIESFQVEGSQIQLTPFETVRSLAFWFGVAYLVVLALVITIRRIAISVHSHDFSGLSKAAAVIASACVVIGVSAYVASHLIDENLTGKSNAMLATASSIASNADDELVSYIKEFKDTGTLTPEASSKLSATLDENTLNSSRAGVYCNYMLACFDSSDEVLGVGSSTGDVLMGWVVKDIDEQNILRESQEQAVASTYKTKFFDEHFVSVPIFDAEKNMVGAIAAHASTIRVYSSTLNQVFAIFAALASALIMVSFVFIESKDWAHAFKLRAQLLREKYQHSEMALCRPICFLCVAATSVDSALLVVIADELTKASGMEGGGVLVSIPLVAQSLGYTVGAPIYIWMAKRMPARPLLIITCIICIACCLGCAFFIAANNLIAFIIALFLASAFNDVLLNYTSILPMYSESNEQRSTLNRSISAAKISGSALAILVAGALVQTFGNPFAYILGAGITAAALLFVIVFIPASKTPAAIKPSKGRAKGGFGGVIQFVSDAPIAAVLLFLTIPIAIASGYKSFLFPLFASDAGMDKTMISSIVAMCKALVFYAVPILAAIESRMGTKSLITTFTLLLAAVFGMFIVNDTIIWAVITLIASSLIIKMLSPAITTFWQNRCKQTGADPNIGQSTMSVLDSGADTLRSPALGALLQAFGRSASCAILGIYCAVSIFAFSAIVKVSSRGEKPDS